MNARLIDLSGRVFGRWTVLRRAFRDDQGKTWWTCRCACGAVHDVNGCHLRDGRSKQCKSCVRRTHGATRGRRPTTEYVVWSSMIARCHNPENRRYADYGGRGITVCARWRDSFDAFLADMGPRPSPDHSIDRVENGKGYEPSNCRWATSTQQNRNRRDTRTITAFGQSRCAAEWSEATGIKTSTIKARIKRGWPAEKAVSILNGPSYAAEGGGRGFVLERDRAIRFVCAECAVRAGVDITPPPRKVVAIGPPVSHPDAVCPCGRAAAACCYGCGTDICEGCWSGHIHTKTAAVAAGGVHA